tara:strand:+ start:36 stop:1286 length:1251 start_codon:yes stop_codon:yes gene_type:complete
MAHQQTDASASQTRLGSRNFEAGNRDLYLKLFSGEMFKGFQHNTIARDLVMKRTLKNGRSLQFIYTGRTTAEYHTPGNSILGNSDGAPPVAEKTITCDDLLISSAFVYELDETLAHYELRGEISKKIGYALAEKYDRLIFRAITRGARSKSPLMKTSWEEPGGTQIQVGDGGEDADGVKAAYNPAALVDAFYDAAAALDEKGISGDGRVAVLSPRQYYALINATGDSVASTNLINRDAQGTALQNGNGIISIAGIKIFKSMNIPFFGNYGVRYGPAASANSTGDNLPGAIHPGNTGDFVGQAMENAEFSDTGINNDYGKGKAEAGDNPYTNNDFTNSCGLIFQREAAGIVEAIGPQVQVTSGDVSVVYQGDVILGRLAMGADYLNPAACVELFAGTTDKPGRFGATQSATNNHGYQ